MRIAFVVSNLTYPPREGLHQQSIVTAQMLAGPEHEFHLFGFVRDADALDQQALARDTGLRFHLPPIPTRLPDILLGLANRLLPLSLRSRRIAALAAALPGYDIVHLENVGAIGLVRPGLARRVVLGLIDPGTLRWRRFAESAQSAGARWSARSKRLLHLLLERLTLTPGATAHVVSGADAGYLQARYPAVRVAAIPVALPTLLERTPSSLPTTGRPTLLVFLDLRQAHLRRSFLWFCREVLARCGPTRAAELVVLGRVEADAELAEAVAGLDTAFIAWADDYRTPLAEATIVATPDLVGTGLKNRVLQSMAMARPVVGTSVAFEGIDAEAERDAVIADDPAEMAAQLDRLIEDRSRCSAIGAAGRAHILARFSAASVQRRWLTLYDAILTGRDGSI